MSIVVRSLQSKAEELATHKAGRMQISRIIQLRYCSGGRNYGETEFAGFQSGSLLQLCRARFLIQGGPPAQGIVLPTVGWAILPEFFRWFWAMSN